MAPLTNEDKILIKTVQI